MDTLPVVVAAAVAVGSRGGGFLHPRRRCSHPKNKSRFFYVFNKNLFTGEVFFLCFVSNQMIYPKTRVFHPDNKLKDFFCFYSNFEPNKVSFKTLVLYFDIIFLSRQKFCVKSNDVSQTHVFVALLHVIEYGGLLLDAPLPLLLFLLLLLLPLEPLPQRRIALPVPVPHWQAEVLLWVSHALSVAEVPPHVLHDRRVGQPLPKRYRFSTLRLWQQIASNDILYFPRKVFYYSNLSISLLVPSRTHPLLPPSEAAASVGLRGSLQYPTH